MEKEKENQEQEEVKEVKGNGIEIEEETDDDNEEEGVEVDKEFGILLFQNLNGEGYELRPIPLESGRVLRMATIHDVITLVATVHSNHLGAIAANKVVEILNHQKGKLVKPRGIFARGR